MDSSHLTPQQVARLQATIGRYLRYLNRMCGRMQQLSFPLDDPLCQPAHRARDAAQDLYTAAHYCGCRPRTPQKKTASPQTNASEPRAPWL